MSKTIAIVVVLVLAIGGAYVLFQVPPAESPAPPGAAGESGFTTPPAPVGGPVVISYTDAGYAPARVAVKRGETVVFRNDSAGGREMWPASAVHPKHAVYPTTGGCLGSTFDACRAVPAGGSWSFTFDFSGTWRYHDHLNFSRTGTVVVE